MRRYIDTLGWAFTVYGAFIVAISVVVCVAGLAIVLLTDGFSGEIALVLALVATVVPLFAVPFLATGWGIRGRRPWARIAGLVLSVLVVTDIPIGFALGAFGLGTLLDREVRAEFAATATNLR
ncbi:MAG: hypothetical protein JRJ84_11595 [Deltaproteobacteria bacterium]|nr:hypothetical protein [Deltaproteobacteria bacterium]